MTHAHAQNTPTTPPTPPAGRCAVDVTLADTLPSNFNLPEPVANQVTLFHSTNMTVTLVCAGELLGDRSRPFLTIGVGTTITPLQGGISGVSANVTNPVRGAVTCGNGGSVVGISRFSIGSTNLSLGSSSAGGLGTPIRVGDVCTVVITATLNYYANGAAFNNTASSTSLMTDPNPATTFKYRSFVREGDGLLATGYNGPNNLPFSTLSATGITPFTITVQTPKTCVVSNAVNKLLTFALPTLDAKTVSLKNNTGAGLRNFAIVLSGCTVGPGANTITGTIDFTAPTGTGVSTAWIENSALPLTSRADNVFTLLRDQNQNVIAKGSSITLTQNGSTTISAQYVSRQGAGVTISPGKVKGVAILTLGYQ